jgi:transcription initiation factor TFIIB
LIAGCLIIAGRTCNNARTFREIHAVTRVPKKEIGRVFKALEKFFTQRNLEKLNSEIYLLVSAPPLTRTLAIAPTDTRSTNAVDLCIRFCSALGLNHDCIKVSQGLAEKMGNIGGLAGRSPLSAAAACIYFASNLMKQPKTAKEISGVAGVSDGTIRTSYKLLEAEKEKLVDPAWIANGKGDLSLLPKV